MPTRPYQKKILRVTNEMTPGSPPLSGCPSEPLCVRVKHLCNRDFRAEPWYMDNLYMITAVAAAAGCLFLAIFTNGYPANGAANAKGYVLMLFLFYSPSVGLPFISTIPSCAMVNGMLLQQYSPFLIRLAIDCGKRYRLSRWIFYLSAPFAAIIFSALFSTWPAYALIAPAVWASFCLLVRLYASCMGVYSVWSQVLS